MLTQILSSSSIFSLYSVKIFVFRLVKWRKDNVVTKLVSKLRLYRNKSVNLRCRFAPVESLCWIPPYHYRIFMRPLSIESMLLGTFPESRTCVEAIGVELMNIANRELGKTAQNLVHPNLTYIIYAHRTNKSHLLLTWSLSLGLSFKAKANSKASLVKRKGNINIPEYEKEKDTNMSSQFLCSRV